MSRYIDADAVFELFKPFKDMFTDEEVRTAYFQTLMLIHNTPSIDIVRCKECKHRPIKEDADGENYGFNLIEPTEGDERCPCLVSDGWYSWMPQDDFYCGFGEREGE